MRLSDYYLPLLREAPEEAVSPSHKYMLRAGLVRQSSAGIYIWLPLGLKVLQKIEAIVRAEQEEAGAVELLMPTIQPAELWQESGRYGDYGPEMLRIKDRQGRDMLYGPTNEEMITRLVRGEMASYRDAGKILYHIQWKFRDEIRPRFGVMRGREFLMKDGYSFDVDVESARRSYNKMFICYLRSFARMGLHAIPVAADTGPIGGDLSHEFLLVSNHGESELYCHKALLEKRLPQAIDYNSDLAPLVAEWMGYYAAESGKHDAARYEKEVPTSERVAARGIEVGHIFFFGDKYSKPLGAKITGADGAEHYLQCGSYGIGVSRLAGAIIEASHDDKGIIWPEPVAPFDLALVNLTPEDSACTQACEDLYKAARTKGIEVLYDDTAQRAGMKLNAMDLVGLPNRIVVGRKNMPKVELSRRVSPSEVELLAPNDALAQVAGRS